MSLTPSIPSTASASTSSHDVPSSMDPALVSVLRHGSVPTETQARELKQLLDSGEFELSKLDRTITTLSLLPSELKSQSSQQSESLVPVRGALSALRRFPPEILGYIFVMCAEHDRTNRTSIADARRAPVLLGHVCSRWRIISHGNPRLWDRVVLPTSSSVDTDTASVVRDLLARSQNLPLALSVVNLTRWWNMAYPPVDNTLFFEILWGSHSRLKDITLEIKPRKIAQLAPRQDTLFPQLATLSIHVSAADCPGGNRRRNRRLFLDAIDLVRILAGFRHAPFLHSLDLSCVNHCAIPLSPFTFPWAQLKNLRMQIPSALSQALDIFLQCPQLERARFSVRELDATYRKGMPPHVHHNLRELYLAVEDPDFDASLFLRDFTFPNLERIYMDVGYLDPSAFQPFYTRSNFKLRHLHLQNIADMTADDVFAFIQFCPTLQSISIINCDCAYEAALFEIFTHDRNASWRAISLPMLTTLSIGLDYEWDGTAVADMADCLSEHGGQDSPFPVLERIYLMTHSCEPNARYGEAVEARLAAVAATGFLVRDVSPYPDDITLYIKENGRWT
ncbi:hypothetical protein FB451DRAFT_1263332 [Mycena latifolia]|nr:hypothetical protein FB451DRAFT_1263332 [Mycena latifolia]